MKVFVIGATGYIGGAVTHALVQDGHDVSGLARSSDSAAKLRQRGVSPRIGTLFDRQVIVDAASAADAVVNAADSDNAYAVTALLEAFADTAKRIVHTSGSSIVGDRARGELTETIHYEASRPIARLEKRGRTAIDDAILGDAKNGVVICPTMVYGVGAGLHTESVQVPMLARLARDLGAGAHIGAGNNRWSNVHIEDLVSDPLNPLSHRALGDLLKEARHYADAIASYQASIAADPEHSADTIAKRGLAYYLAGQLPAARSSCEENPSAFRNAVCLAIVYDRIGLRGEASAALAGIIKSSGDSAAYQYAQVYAQWGDHNTALKWLERAVQIRDPGLLYTRTDPLLEPLRNEPRFQAIERQLKFPI